jgi:acyl-CoA hydrolase
MAEIVFPNHTNHLGTLFGGQALAWMDKAAFLAAARYSRRTVVTARSDQVDFKLPIRIGQMVETIGRIVEVGRSSMKVRWNWSPKTCTAASASCAPAATS